MPRLTGQFALSIAATCLLFVGELHAQVTYLPFTPPSVGQIQHQTVNETPTPRDRLNLRVGEAVTCSIDPQTWSDTDTKHEIDRPVNEVSDTIGLVTWAPGGTASGQPGSVYPVTGTSTTFTADLAPDAPHDMTVTATIDDSNALGDDAPVTRSVTFTIANPIATIAFAAGSGPYLGFGSAFTTNADPSNDSDRIILNGTISNSTATSYNWIVVNGPGNGFFQTSSSQNPQFRGSAEGPATLRLTVETPYGPIEAEQVVYVIKVADLPGLFSDEDAQFLELNNSIDNVDLPYSAGGDLYQVLVQVPASSSFLWNRDYAAHVSHTTGLVQIALVGEAPFLASSVRKSAGSPASSQLHNWHHRTIEQTEDQGRKVKADSTVKSGAPAADLILLSNKYPDTDFAGYKIAYAGQNWKGVDSVASAIQQIQNHRATLPANTTFTVVICDHGTWGNQSVGDGQEHIAGKYLSLSRTQDVEAFAAACWNNGDRPVSKVRLNGCVVGGLTLSQTRPGKALLEKLAQDGHMIVEANTKSVYISPGGRYYEDHDNQLYTVNPP